MTVALTIVFGFMVFMIILSKGRIVFFSVSSFLVVAAISLGIGYGIAVLLIALAKPALQAMLVIGAVFGGVMLLKKR